jgi:diaminohydroxyphosphoribosylaminopyrimidine deaminase/5-amino-6-(5-phosphoribosylamino)uracil reductase
LQQSPETDLVHLRRAFELARGGVGLVSPNPLVGCVIVSENGEAVGEGAYFKTDVTHAEIIALMQAGTRAQGGTAYVSLEPHAHHGKTPPCTEALINAGIRRVVAPIEDPNPLVSGRGFERLRAAGIEVVTGILAKEAAMLNEKFICWHQKQRPFVQLKLAMSLDGRISVDGSVSTALSASDAIGRVHELRHEHDAILVGANTVAVDDPSLTDRSGKRRRRPLVRIILDNRLSTPFDAKVVVTAAEVPTIIFTNSHNHERIEGLKANGVDVVISEMGGRDLDAVLAELKRREIQSVLVEGGTEVAGSFVDARLVDKVTFIAAPLIIGGREAPAAIGGAGAATLGEALKLRDISVTRLGSDLEITAYPAKER